MHTVKENHVKRLVYFFVIIIMFLLSQDNRNSVIVQLCTKRYGLHMGHESRSTNSDTDCEKINLNKY